MHLIVCIEDQGGVSFAGRRLSSDRVLTEYILSLVAHSRLWIAPYSAKLYTGENVCAAEDYLTRCQPGEYCLLEKDISLIPPKTLESLTLCRWNRRYPATVYFPQELLAGMHLVSTEDFPGNSHENITVERYMP